MNRIGVWNTAFMGDAILTLPLIQSLALRYPESTIDFYVREGLEPLFQAHPAIHHVYGFNKRSPAKSFSSLIRTGKTLRRRGYDLWISAHSSPRSALIARLTSSPIRIGYGSPVLNTLFYTRTVDRKFNQYHEIQRLLRLLQPLGEGPVSEWPQIALPREAEDAAVRFFSGLQGQRVLGLHPGSVWATKRWLPEYFADITVKAVESGIHVVMFGGPSERELAGTITDTAHNRLPVAARDLIHNVSGMLSLTHLAAYISRLDCYLANDSGPTHIAWSMGTPVVALWGPSSSGLGFSPLGKRTRILEIDLDCRPCGLHGPQKCPQGHHRCMTGLEPGIVWPAIQELMHTS